MLRSLDLKNNPPKTGETVSVCPLGRWTRFTIVLDSVEGSSMEPCGHDATYEKASQITEAHY